ncbi:unnamed protein product [Rotaria sp. Silwood2]|nr:unnamed protein product [Rotaria sp. Silwood2]CAF4110152.1 unnamed protein product [Rotaria sp. Silwood2]
MTSSLLALKILRHLIPLLPESTDKMSSILIKNLLVEVFNSIGGKFSVQRITPDIITELINFYRTSMSLKSPWQSVATQLVIDSISLNFNDFESFENIDKNQLIDFVASLGIMGTYIQPYCLGSIVKIYADDGNSNEYNLALITEVDINARDLGIPEASPYYVQYFQKDKAEWVAADKLKLEIDVPPPNPYLFSHADGTIDLILDKLAYFIQLDTSTSNSIVLLQLKRRCIGALCQLLNDRKLVEIFMQKSYVSLLAKLAVCSLPLTTRLQLFDLRHFSKDHLEQYCLSLDNYEHSKQIVENDHEKENFHYDMKQNNTTDTSPFSIWDNIPINRDRKIVDTLTTSVLKYNGWKIYASEAEIELFKRGRIGNDDLYVTPMPYRIPPAQVLQELCIDTTNDSDDGNFPTYIIDNLQVSEGKWYFCVKLPLGELVQIGWATAGFSPDSRNGLGIGDDSYSWSYDGSRHVLFHDGSHDYPVDDDIHWKVNDVCGCGIEIDGENTRIKYWLNGKFLGTAFAHRSYLGSSRTKCDMRPNGPNTTYFPGVSMQSYSYCSNRCELLLSPEDMTECPLPDGYKPLLLPKLVNTENSIVAYPFNAYLIGDNMENYIYTSRLSSSKFRLRDFVNENHLETSFILDDHHLILPENSGGFSFPIDNSTSSSTVSFDFKFLTTSNHDSSNKTNIHLLKLNSMDLFSVEIPTMNDVNEDIRITIVFYPTEQQTKLYMNDKCRIFYGGFDYEKRTTSLTLHILPNGGAAIRNLAIWKYALSEEHIHRLVTYGLSYVASDNEQLNEYRRQANVFTFSKNQQMFANELLVPFNQPFEKSLWQKNKTQVDNDESHYFKTIDGTNQSVVQLCGNKTYLVLDISTEHNFGLTLVLDIYVPSFPKNNERLTLVMLNPQLSICIAHDGRLFLLSDGQTLNMSTLNVPLNEYVRFAVLIDDNYGKIYLNGSLALENDKFTTKTNPICLFREKDSTTNTTGEDKLRIECKLIAFLNQAVSIDYTMESSQYSLESWLAPPLSLVLSRLSAIGYKETWITSVIKQSKALTLQMADMLIREQKEQLIKNDQKNRRDYYVTILSQLAPSIDQEKLENKIMFTRLENEVELLAVAEMMLVNWNDLQMPATSTDDNDETESESEDIKWFQKAVRGLCTKNSFTEWIQQRSINNHSDELVYQLLDLNKPQLEQSVMMTMTESSQKTIHKSIQYSHQQISQKQYSNSRIACEQGLISIYAREAIFNLLKIWSNNGQILSIIDLSLAPTQSIVADRLRNAKNYLLYQKKFELFEESLEETNLENVHRPTVEFDPVKATMESENGKNTMFYQAYEQLHKDAHRSFRNEDDHLWEATYIGMHSIDAGGPYRDSITCICSDICSTRLPLFMLCPNGRTNIGLNRDRWIPNVFPQNESIPDTFKNQYRFVGQLMGMAIRKKHYLDLKFPLFLWKQLAREQVTIEDIEAIDIQCFKIIKEMQANFTQDELIDVNIDINYLFSSIMSELRFEVVSSAGQSYELVPGGKEIALTAANFKDYCTKYQEYRLNEFSRQIEFIRQGLYSVVPCYYLSLFTAGELEEAVCGKGHIDIELLKRNTRYGDSNDHDLPHIERFWTVLKEMFNEEQKKSFIIFVWGRSTLPRCDEEFTCKFCINPYYESPDEVDKMLPRSHTCTFALDLPEYSTTDIMYQRLNYAITNCSSIDGDG